MKVTGWLFIALIGCQFWDKSAIAGTLEYWKFNSSQSRLEIITNDRVKPQVQLLPNPTRLVIDLPGITLGGSSIRKPISSFIPEVRLGQFKRRTTRIVIELGADYTIRPNEIRVRGLSPNRWYVQLPKFLPQSEYSLAPEGVNIVVPAAPQSRFLVVIDPGHGGRDTGAIGLRGIQEKHIILSISLEVARILQQKGVQAVLTRSSDRFISLQQRVEIAENANADIFVSIHANSISLSQTAVNGLETYYFSTGKRLAQTIHRNILRRVNIKDRGVRRARFYVLRKTSMPSTLVEVGFVTGNVDSQRLANPAYRQSMAEAIAEGILQFLP